MRAIRAEFADCRRYTHVLEGFAILRKNAAFEKDGERMDLS